METLYKGSAFLGRVYSLIFAIIVTVITIGVTGYLIYKKAKMSGTGQALVTGPNEISFEISGILYKQNTTIPSENKVGDVVDISYEPKNPKNVQVGKVNYMSIIIVAIIGGFFSLICWFYYWLGVKYKPIAALEGAAVIIPGI